MFPYDHKMVLSTTDLGFARALPEPHGSWDLRVKWLVVHEFLCGPQVDEDEVEGLMILELFFYSVCSDLVCDDSVLEVSDRLNIVRG